MPTFFFRLCWTVSALCLSLPTLAQSQAQVQAPVTTAALPPGVSSVTTVEGITEYRLPNGLQVLLVADSSKPTVTVNVTYRVGSRHENYGETGMAHLLEHLVFKGTPTTRNAFGEFTRRGLRANGTTSWDRTNYFASFAANDDNLRWYLSWQADVMVNSFIARADLDSEMTVVRNEMEMGENNPGGVLFRRTLGAMFDWHNYGKATIGARSDVENVDITRLQSFYKMHYQPDNATLIVSGRFDPASVLQWVAKDFGAIPRPTRVLAPTYTLDAAQDGERGVSVQRVGGTPQVFMAYHLPPAAHPDFAAATLLAQVLSDAPAGRLHKRLVDKQLAASVFGTALGMTEAGVLLVGAALAPGQDLAAATAEMSAALDGLGAEPIAAEELERARRQWLNGWEQSFTDPEAVGVQLSAAIAKGDWRLYFLERDRVAQASLADLQRVASTYLVAANRTVARYLPTDKPQRAPAPQKVDVAVQLQGFTGKTAGVAVEAFEATPTTLQARTQTRTLASGLKVGLLPKGTRGQAVQARLTLRFGDGAALFGQDTAVAMMGAVIDKGVDKADGTSANIAGQAAMSRQQVSDAFDKLRAEVGFSASGQRLSVRISTQRQNLPAVIELVGRVLRSPSLPADAFEEARRQWLAGIEAQRKEPGAVIGNALERHGNPYPKGDLRYAETFEEGEAAVKALTLVQVRTVHQRFMSASVGEFAAVGDMDAAAVNAALDRAFGDWRQPAAGPQAYLRQPNPLFARPPARLVLATPDKQNANFQAVLALPINDTHADYAALMVANHIFGAGGASRLWKRIREKDGLSYDVGSFVGWNNVELNSSWGSTAIFAPQNQPKVEAAWREELARSLKDGFTQTELDEARQGLLSFRRLSRAQDGSVAGTLENNLRLGRSFLISQQTDDKLAALTLAQVNAAWRQYIVPERVVSAWGGDFKPAP